MGLFLTYSGLILRNPCLLFITLKIQFLFYTKRITSTLEREICECLWINNHSEDRNKPQNRRYSQSSGFFIMIQIKIQLKLHESHNNNNTTF
jgi:hypothetical protein